jgi:S-formylglutathione hydrolase FrmB
MKKFTLFIAALAIAKLLTAQVNIVDDSFYSDVLGQTMLVDVYLPPGYDENPDQYYPVIYFWHGWGGNQNSLIYYAPKANTMILNGSIDPFIMVCPNNQSGPFGGTEYMYSPLWGDFETFNVNEVVEYIEANYRAIPERNKRALMGQSMGGSGCFENGPKHKDRFRAIAAHGYPGVFEQILLFWQTSLLNEHPSGPPYYYDFNTGGTFTKLTFLASGAYAPNQNSPQTYINPAIVEYLFDDQGAVNDTVLSKWLEHSGHVLVQQLTPDDDFGILFGDGQNDEFGFYPGTLALKDSLDAYGIPGRFFSHTGGHAMPVSFMQEAYTFLDSIFNIVDNHCLPEGITFYDQPEIDHFQDLHPGCNMIEGDVEIGAFVQPETTVQNLEGLSVITDIGGNLTIHFNNYLETLSGLNNLVSIGGDLIIETNEVLKDLNGLESLQSIGGQLQITANESLSDCATQSICNYLVAPNGTVEIHDNAPGCNSPEEVEEACFTSIKENANEVVFYISPNPATDIAVIVINIQSPAPINVCVYNLTGTCLKNWEFEYQSSGKQSFTLNFSDLPAGIYFICLHAGNEMVTKKIIKVQ